MLPLLISLVTAFSNGMFYGEIFNTFHDWIAPPGHLGVIDYQELAEDGEYLIQAETIFEWDRLTRYLEEVNETFGLKIEIESIQKGGLSQWKPPLLLRLVRERGATSEELSQFLMQLMYAGFLVFYVTGDFTKDKWDGKMFLWNDAIGVRVESEKRKKIWRLYPEPQNDTFYTTKCIKPEEVGMKVNDYADELCIDMGGGRDVYWEKCQGGGTQKQCRFKSGRDITLTECIDPSGKNEKYRRSLHVDNCRKMGGVIDPADDFQYEMHTSEGCERMECPIPVDYGGEKEAFTPQPKEDEDAALGWMVQDCSHYAYIDGDGNVTDAVWNGFYGKCVRPCRVGWEYFESEDFEGCVFRNWYKLKNGGEGYKLFDQQHRMVYDSEADDAQMTSTRPSTRPAPEVSKERVCEPGFAFNPEFSTCLKKVMTDNGYNLVDQDGKVRFFHGDVSEVDRCPAGYTFNPKYGKYGTCLKRVETGNGYNLVDRFGKVWATEPKPSADESCPSKSFKGIRLLNS